MTYEDLSGMRFGRLTIVSRIGSDEKRRSRWMCECDCGGVVIVCTADLKKGNTRSCGCLNRERVGEAHTTHDGSGLKTYPVLRGMINRCYNEYCDSYKYYGGRGITVCEEWRNDPVAFDTWSRENGWMRGLSIDRIDNNRGYSPDNCRWVNMETQQRNRRNNRAVTYNGETRTITEWAEILGMNRHTVKTRLQRGWSVERAFEKPVRR